MESSDPLDLTLLLAAILHRAERRVGTEHGYLCLVNSTLNKLEIVYGTGLATPYNDALIGRGEGLAGKIWESGAVIHIPDYSEWLGRVVDTRTQNRRMANAALGVPIRLAGEVVGVIGLFFAEKGRDFTSEEIAFFIRMGESAGTILHNAASSTTDPIQTHIEAFHHAVDS